MYAMINSNAHPTIDRESWQRAWRSRCCPPDHVLRAAGKSADLASHLDLCPWCRQAVEEPPLGFSLEPSSLVQDAAVHPQVGELWGVKPSLGGWGEKARYYSAPVVLVVEETGDGIVSVMQVCDDEHFSGPGDVSLQPDCHGFVETWNRYSLCADHLVAPVGRVAEEVLTACRETATVVAGGVIEQGSLLWFFRNMEVETGFFFARQAMGKVLKIADGNEANGGTTGANSAREWLLGQPPAAVRQQLTRLGLHCRTNDTAEITLADILASTVIPDDALPLAAADGKDTLSAIIFTCRYGMISEFDISHFDINHLDLLDSTLLVGGVFAEVQPAFDEFFCWLKTATGLMDPIPGSCGSTDCIFWAAFDIRDLEKPPDKSDIILRYIRYE